MARTVSQPSALAILDAAFHLLRTAPMSCLAAYYTGTLPFLWAFLFFWTQLSHSTRAAGVVDALSVLCGVAFVWMCCWQTASLASLRAHLLGAAPLPWTIRRAVRLVTLQTLVQSLSLVLLPLAATTFVGFPWAYSFFQHFACVAPDVGPANIRKAAADSRARAAQWWEQALFLMLLVALLALFVFANFVLLLLILPELVKMLTGVESVWERSLRYTLNSTLFAVAAALAYAVIDPLVKTAFLIRGFHIDAIRTGVDLEPRRRALVSAALLLMLASGAAARAEPAPAVTPVQLDRAIRRVSVRAEYDWRVPRAASEDDLQSRRPLIRFLARTTAGVRRPVVATLRWIGNRLNDFVRWVFGPDGANRNDTNASSGVSKPIRVALFALLLLLAGGLVAVLLRMRRRRRATAAIPVGAAAMVTIDLSSPDVSADLLAEDQWLGLAEEWMGKGDLRLALRSLYLASLAYLGRRNLIRIERGKSNLDYRLELGRRARAMPDLQAVFAGNVGVFERSWYGMHEVDEALCTEFHSNLTRMKACAEP